MRIFFILSIGFIIASCNRNIFGTYNTAYSKDKSVFFQIRLNTDNTAEKIEVHTIRDDAKGTFVRNGKTLACYFETSKSGFPPDTLYFRLRQGNLYFLEGNNVSKVNFLVKE